MIPDIRRALVVLAFTLIAGSACAQTPSSKMTLHFDPAGTKINWTLKSVLHSVHGTFRLKGGLITVDKETGTAEGEIIVETASGESGNSSRDRRMRDDVLESSKYPEAIFHPQKVVGVVHAGQTQTIAVEGTFTIHGVDHSLTLQVKTTSNGGALTAETNFEVPYVAWGMKDPSTLMLRVAKQVQVNIDSRATLE